MKVLLLNPKNTVGSYTIIPNISLGYLASALLKGNNQVMLLDAVKENLSFRNWEEYLANNSFDVVGIYVSTPSVGSVKEYIKIIKRVSKETIVVLGGPHPTFEPIETMQTFSEADFAFWGEGENGVLQLVEKLENNGNLRPDDYKGIQNLIWRSGDEIICNPKQIIEDISELAFPAWDLIKPDQYPTAPNGIFSKKRRIAPIITTRGCPYPCGFCGASRAMGKKVRMRNLDGILEEITLLRDKFGIEEIHIMDDSFTQNRELVLNLCEKLMENNLNITWAHPAGIRLDTLDEELLRIMEKSGCYSLAVGIESGSQRVLDLMKKSLTLELVREKIALIKDVSNIRLTGFFIIGYPGETISEINQTIDFAKDLKLDRANFFNFSPFPGSEIYEKLKKSGQLNNLNYDRLYIHSISYSPKGISKGQMKRLQRKAHLRFYLRPKILLNLLREIKSFSQIKVILRRALAILFPNLKVLR